MSLVRPNKANTLLASTEIFYFFVLFLGGGLLLPREAGIQGGNPEIKRQLSTVNLLTPAAR